MSSLYGDMPILAVKSMIEILEKNGKSATYIWAHYGKFLYEQYKDDKFDDKIVKELLDDFKNQNHSGVSHGVVQQEMMNFLCGKMSEKDKQKITKQREVHKMNCFIPPKCTHCGDTLMRISNVNPNLICINNNCKMVFELLGVTI